MTREVMAIILLGLSAVGCFYTLAAALLTLLFQRGHRLDASG
jgi:hypothetical protein